MSVNAETFLANVRREISERSLGPPSVLGNVDIGTFLDIIRRVVADSTIDADDVDAIVAGLEQLYEAVVDIPGVPEWIEDRTIDVWIKPKIREFVVWAVDLVS